MVKSFPPNARTEFVDLVCGGMSILAAARRVGATHGTGRNWWAQSGQMMTVSMGAVGGLSDPAPTGEGPGGRALNLAERGMIQMGRRGGLSYTKIGEPIGRDKSVAWREVDRNTSADGVYYASVAHTRAHQARRRPKPLKLVGDEALCRLIAVWMDDGWSPKLISARVAFYFADDQTMQVSHETIYQALYVQTRGSLRADLAEKLSLKRKQRVPHAADRHKNSPYKKAFKISERPARGSGPCGARALGVSMFLSSRLSAARRCGFPVGGVVAEHGPDDVDTASGECDERLLVGLSLAAFPVVVGSGRGTVLQA
ncbi:hypothetical protein ABIB51_001581 [Arthrobacter sp. UYCu712]